MNKRSEIKWLGIIPNNWEVKKANYVFSERSTKGNKKNLEILTPSQYYGVIPQKMYCLITGSKPVQASIEKDLNQFKTIHEGDFCISLSAYMGGIEYSNYEGVVSAAYHVIYKNIDICNNYYKYLFKCDMFVDELNKVTPQSVRVGRNTSYYDFSRIYLPFPPIEEQTKISLFLEDKCSRIQSIYKKIEIQIDNLKEYKKALVTNTVKIGINSNFTTINSGVLEIGEIKNNYLITRLKFLLAKEIDNLKVGPFGSALPSSAYIDVGKRVYNQRIVLDNNFKENATCITDELYKKLISFSVHPEDILITTRGTLGKIAVVPENAPKGILHPCLIRFRVNKNIIDFEYLKYLFNDTQLILEQIKRMSNSTTIEALYSYNLKDVSIIVPPLNEQKKIVEYLNEKCFKINNLIDEKLMQLQKLDNYKKSLIFEYTTGKKRVINE